ncbi:15859_t:CDS:2 [Funneliformis caledonium]|uniref:15859_t:CDS:1 n=2 Tax=Funneliformis TaxID=1117308 RepID=A0A9N9EGE2_9GLOM|nr:4185_t:CDS:2 [Funneliformis mosseae]CAG8677521.1 15859_t:CDS:2 [Funneliformis caledonium]
MQMDEDVGKVAQATPVLISKALELFMQSLIDHACQETKARNAKRMSVSHLKKTIMTTEQFDFLKDVVANIPDLVETGDGEASSSTISAGIISNMDVVLSDEAEPSVPVQIKKRKGRKKNVDDEEYKTSTTTNPPRTRRSARKRKETNDTEEAFIKTE